MRLFLMLFISGAYHALGTKYGWETDFGFPTWIIIVAMVLVFVQDLKELTK